MKLVRLGPDGVFHRYLTPKWAYVPLSGAGAAAEGGRFNRPGVEALYLSRQPETALAEYRQNASIVPPATLAAYVVDITSVVDLSGATIPRSGRRTGPAGIVRGRRSRASSGRCRPPGDWPT